jgi:hypothetical protein
VADGLNLTAADVARAFHEAYERLAPDFGYRTREASAKPWADVPEQNRALEAALGALDLAGREAAAVERTAEAIAGEIEALEGRTPDVHGIVAGIPEIAAIARRYATERGAGGDASELKHEDVQALFDIATGSMDFGSGFLDTDEVDALRRVAVHLGVDPMVATPRNFAGQYPHPFEPVKGAHPDYRGCARCSRTADQPPHTGELP